MASIRFRAGILAYNADYYGAKTILATKSFELDKVSTLTMGYIQPPTDSGVGSASNALGFSETQIASTDKVGAYVLYQEKQNQLDRYLITCTSAELESMQGLSLTASSVPLYKSLVVATGSGYTLAP